MSLLLFLQAALQGLRQSPSSAQDDSRNRNWQWALLLHGLSIYGFEYTWTHAWMALKSPRMHWKCLAVVPQKGCWKVCSQTSSSLECPTYVECYSTHVESICGTHVWNPSVGVKGKGSLTGCPASHNRLLVALPPIGTQDSYRVQCSSPFLWPKNQHGPKTPPWSCGLKD